MSMGSGVLTRIAELTRRLICAMHGHDSLLHFEHGRMSLLCSSCGYESPGWELKGARQQAAKTRPRMVRLVDERRVA